MSYFAVSNYLIIIIVEKYSIFKKLEIIKITLKVPCEHRFNFFLVYAIYLSMIAARKDYVRQRLLVVDHLSLKKISLL